MEVSELGYRLKSDGGENIKKRRSLRIIGPGLDLYTTCPAIVEPEEFVQNLATQVMKLAACYYGAELLPSLFDVNELADKITRWTCNKANDEQCVLDLNDHRAWTEGVDEPLVLSSDVPSLKVPEARRKLEDGEQKLAVLILGGPATGKSQALKIARKKYDPQNKWDEGKMIYINTDDVMADQPGYKKLLTGLGDYGELPITDRDAANKYHAAAKEMATDMFNEAIKKDYDVVFDGTGTNKKKVKSKVEKLKSLGYKVQIVHTVLSPEKALARSQSRANKTGRFVPQDVILKSNPGTDVASIIRRFQKNKVNPDEILFLNTDVPKNTPPAEFLFKE
jgi:hypothetical protein